jgi:oxygen-independent coproporphyrinogen-3 oxidase
VSLGVQSFNPKVLKRLERLATLSNIERALGDIRDLGLQLNLDLMFGLPDQELSIFESDVNRAIEFSPHHISCYLLTLRDDHPWFKSEFLQKRWSDESSVEKMYDILCEKLARAGFEHYEISNFSQPNFQSRHNQNYWNVESGYLAIGPGAHGYQIDRDSKYRYQNRRALEDWANSPDGLEEKEALTPDQTQLEHLYFLFRTRRWTPMEASWSEKLIDQMMHEGILERQANQIRLTEKKWILIDAVVSRLLRSV